MVAPILAAMVEAGIPPSSSGAIGAEVAESVCMSAIDHKVTIRGARVNDYLVLPAKFRNHRRFRVASKGCTPLSHLVGYRFA